MIRRITVWSLVLFTCASLGWAQVEQRFNLGAGVGFSVPTERAGRRLITGWNLNVRGGVALTQQLLADLDFTYTNSRFNDATLAQFNEPDGGIGIWSLTFNPVVKLAPPSSRIQPYVTGGYGLYHLNFSLSQPTAVPTVLCDGFFGFCLPGSVVVNQVVASDSTYKGGFNAGVGFDFPLASKKIKLFSEARYHRMFTTHGRDISYIPVTFGIRW